jgi:hypothetical protein
MSLVVILKNFQGLKCKGEKIARIDFRGTCNPRDTKLDLFADDCQEIDNRSILDKSNLLEPIFRILYNPFANIRYPDKRKE